MIRHERALWFFLAAGILTVAIGGDLLPRPLLAQPPQVANLNGRDLNLTGRTNTAPQAVDIDSATTFEATSSYVQLTCTGAETINTITGGLSGMRLLIEHRDTDCTIADDDVTTAADAIDLEGTATNDVGAAAKVIELYYDGANWLQTGESEN